MAGSQVQENGVQLLHSGFDSNQAQHIDYWSISTDKILN